MSNKCSAYNIPQFVYPVSTGMVISAQTQGNSVVDTLSVGGCFAGLANPGQSLIGPPQPFVGGSFPSAPQYNSASGTVQNGGPAENYANKRGSQVVTSAYSHSLLTPPMPKHQSELSLVTPPLSVEQQNTKNRAAGSAGISEKITYTNSLENATQGVVIGDNNTFAPKNWTGDVPQLSFYVNARYPHGGVVYPDPQKTHKEAYDRYILSQCKPKPEVVHNCNILTTSRVVHEANPTFAQFGNTFVFDENAQKEIPDVDICTEPALNQAIALLESYFKSLGLTFALVGVSENLATDIGSAAANLNIAGQMFHYDKDITGNQAQQNYNALVASGGFTIGEVKNAIDIVNKRNFILPVHLQSQSDHPWMPHIAGALTLAARIALRDNDIPGSHIDINRFGITTPISSVVPVRYVLTYSNSMCGSAANPSWNGYHGSGLRIKVKITDGNGGFGYATIIPTKQFDAYREDPAGNYICLENATFFNPLPSCSNGCSGRYFMRLTQTGPHLVPPASVNDMSGVDVNIELDPGGDAIWQADDYPAGGYVTQNTYYPFGEPATPGDTSWKTFVLLAALGTIVDVSPNLNAAAGATNDGWDVGGGNIPPGDISWGTSDNVSCNKPTVG